MGHAAMVRPVLAVLVFASFAPAQDPESMPELLKKLSPGESTKAADGILTLHHKGETKPEESGWYPARSEAAGFSVRMPVPFLSWTFTAPTTDGSTLTMHMIAGHSREGGKFVVMCAQRADRSVKPRGEPPLATMKRRSREFRTSAVRRAVMTGEELAGVTDYGAHFIGQHLVGGDGWQCTLSAEYPRSAAADLDGVARAFIDSFEPPPAPPRR